MHSRASILVHALLDVRVMTMSSSFAIVTMICVGTILWMAVDGRSVSQIIMLLVCTALVTPFTA